MQHCLLVDNGSVRAESTINLRAIAVALQEKIGASVDAASLQHSNRVDPADLGGRPAEVFVSALENRLKIGIQNFVVLPLFFGPSLAVTSHIPGKIRLLRERYPSLKARVAKSLFDLDRSGDDRLARILVDRIEEVRRGEESPPVIVVDHGSPAPQVAEVRNRIARQVERLLGSRAARVAAASMERRVGEKYAFNEPLLETILCRDGFNAGRVIVSMLFLSPGRHAGHGGDVGKICRRAQQSHPGLEAVRTGLVGDHPALLSILADRYAEAAGQG